MRNRPAFMLGIVLCFLINAAVCYLFVGEEDCDVMFWMDFLVIVAFIAIPVFNINIIPRRFTVVSFGILLGSFINMICASLGQEKAMYPLVTANIVCVLYLVIKWSIPEDVEETPASVVEKPKTKPVKMPIHPMQSLFEEKKPDTHGFDVFTENFTNGNTDELEDEFKKWKNEQK